MSHNPAKVIVLAFLISSFLMGNVILYFNVLYIIIGIGGIVLICSLTFPLLCFILNLFFQGRPWHIAAAVSLPYIIGAGLFIAGALMQTGEGIFWRFEFYPVAAVLYLSVVVLTFLASLIHFRTNPGTISLLLVVLAASIWGHIYVRSRDYVRSSTTSFHFAGTKLFTMTADVYCEFTGTRHYLLFSNSDRGGCSYTKVTLSGKDPHLKMPFRAHWVINGAEKQVHMAPTVSDSFNTSWNSSTEQYQSDTAEWSTEFPSAEIAAADQARFKWGEVDLELDETQIANFKELMKGYGAMSNN